MPNPNALHVAVAQSESVLGDLDANLRTHLDVIACARAAGAELLVFPEMSLTGHGAGPDTLRLALRRDHPMVLRIAQAAGAMCTVFGLIEEAPAAQFYNSAFAVQHGRLAFVHRKINLATYGRLEDGKHFSAGAQVRTVSPATHWRAGLLICADTWNPALVHLAALQGATLLLVPVSSALEAVGPEFDNRSGWDTNLRFYALTYGMPVLMANRVGSEGGLHFWGGSRILDAFGHTLALAEGGTAQLLHAQLDFAQVRQARYLLPTLRDANLALVQRETDRVARSISNISEAAED